MTHANMSLTEKRLNTDQMTASMLESEELNDFATFMYCRLNQPDTDHPKELFE